MKLNLILLYILFESIKSDFFTSTFLNKAIFPDVTYGALDKPKNGITYFYSEVMIHKFLDYYYLIKIDSENDEIIENSTFPFEVYKVKHLPNDINMFLINSRNITFQIGETFTNFIIVPYEYSKIDSISYNDDTVILLYYIYFQVTPKGEEPDFRPFLLSFKHPYDSIYNIQKIDHYHGKDNFMKLVALKDTFVLLFNNKDDKKIFTFLIYDYELNLIKIKNITYPDFDGYDQIEISELSEDEKVNEFIICYFNTDKAECKIIKYENSDLFRSLFATFPSPFPESFFTLFI